jgi:tetratricopeptide (TPR) repeat protein
LYCRRGLTNYRLNNLQEAIGDFDQALQIDAHCREALNNRGSAKEALGRVHEAISKLREGKKIFFYL